MGREDMDTPLSNSTKTVHSACAMIIAGGIHDKAPQGILSVLSLVLVIVCAVSFLFFFWKYVSARP